MSSFVQAKRLPDDGSATVTRDGDDYLILAVEGGGSLRVSLFNAARIFAMLAMFLGIKLSAAVGKAITL